MTPTTPSVDEVVPHADEPTPPVDLFAKLEQERDEVAEEAEPLRLPIPAFQTLYVEFRYLPLEDVESKPERYRGMKETLAAKVAAADTVALLCHQLVALVDGEYVPLHQVPGAAERGVVMPVRFDEVCRELFNLPPVASGTGTRQTVLDMYGPRGEYALIEHARKATRWLKDTRRAAGVSLLGE